MKLFITVVLLLYSLVSWHQAHAIERTVWAKVIQVTPLTRTIEAVVPVACHTPKPSAAAGLASLLAWDLRPECSQRDTQRTIGYDVRYTWDGRSYRTHTTKHPGDRIRLSVNFH